MPRLGYVLQRMMLSIPPNRCHCYRLDLSQQAPLPSVFNGFMTNSTPNLVAWMAEYQKYLDLVDAGAAEDAAAASCRADSPPAEYPSALRRPRPRRSGETQRLSSLLNSGGIFGRILGSRIRLKNWHFATCSCSTRRSPRWATPRTW